MKFHYLRMIVDYTQGENVKIRMIYYIYKIISAFDKADPSGRGINTRASLQDLYKVNCDY